MWALPVCIGRIGVRSNTEGRGFNFRLLVTAVAQKKNVSQILVAVIIEVFENKRSDVRSSRFSVVLLHTTSNSRKITNAKHLRNTKNRGIYGKNNEF
jgi:hypothetical protein